MWKVLFISLASVAGGLLLIATRTHSSARVDHPQDPVGREAPQLPAVADTAGVAASHGGGVTYLGDPAGMMVEADEPVPAGAAVPDGRTDQAGAGPSPSELQQLRDEVAMLRRQLEESRGDAQTEQLQILNDQIAALREQRAQESAQREAAAAAAEQAVAQAQDAVDALSSASRRLAYGDSDVLEALDSAEAAVPYPAQLALESARGAIQSEDLSAARYWISQAIVETERSQLTP
jgi:hypothetical protein